MLSTLRRNRPLLVTLVIVLVVLFLMARRFEPKVTASILLSGLTLGALYFLVASGLSLIFGLMDVLNFAQGAVFMIGAYLGFTTYANPRLILNVLPFALAILGGVQVGRWLGGLLPARFRKRWLDTSFLVLLFLLSLALLLIGVRGFDLGPLAAAAATATGGAVATELAQEPAAVYLLRLALLAAAGLFLGVGLSRVGKVQVRQRTRGTAALVGLVLVAAAFALVPLRTPAETFLLGVSSNVRFVLALLVGLLAGAGLGALIEVSLIRPLYGRPLYQILLTLGLGYVGTELVKSVWGTAGFYMDIPAFFNGEGRQLSLAQPVVLVQRSLPVDQCAGPAFPQLPAVHHRARPRDVHRHRAPAEAHAAGHHHPRGRARQRDGAGAGDQRAAGLHPGLRDRLRIGGGGRCRCGALPRRQPGAGR